MIVLNVYYKAKPGKRDAFFRAVQETGAPQGSRAEAGNRKYDYYLPVDDDADTLLLVEHWKDEEAFKFHTEQSYFKKLQDLKAEYLEDTKIVRSEVED